MALSEAAAHARRSTRPPARDAAEQQHDTASATSPPAAASVTRRTGRAGRPSIASPGKPPSLGQSGSIPLLLHRSPKHEQIQKRILVAERLRRPPATGWSWVDRRFLREHGDHLSREAMLLYLFLAAVADRHGLSFYSDHTLTSRLRLSQPVLEQARQELLDRDLIAHQLPLVQVLSLPAPGVSRRPEPGQGLMLLGDLFRQVAAAANSRPKEERAMNVALWAEIRRLAEIDKLSGRAIARRLHCSRHTVAAALKLQQPPRPRRRRRVPACSIRTWSRSRNCWPSIPTSRPCASARRSPADREGYTGSATVLRRYLRKVRPARGRVYQEVHYQPAQAMQVDWGECGRVQVGSTTRKVSVFVAVLCYSRLLYIEFTLSQRKAEFYRGLVNALTFFGGSPRNLIFDNLKAAVLNGSGRQRLFPSRVPGPVRLFLSAAGRLRPARPGIERRCGRGRALREAQRPGRPGRRTAPLRGLPGPGAHLARSGGQRAASTRPPASGRSIASSRSVRCCGRCPPSPSTPTKSCRPSSARMPASPSTAIAIPRRRSSCADPSPCAPTVMSCACCTKARWWRNTSAVTSAASCSCCRNTAWQR